MFTSTLGDSYIDMLNEIATNSYQTVSSVPFCASFDTAAIGRRTLSYCEKMQLVWHSSGGAMRAMIKPIHLILQPKYIMIAGQTIVSRFRCHLILYLIHAGKMLNFFMKIKKIM